MNKVIKNNIFLLYIFFCQSNYAFADSKKPLPVPEKKEKANNIQNNKVSEIERENFILEMQTKHKFLQMELKRRQNELENYEKNFKEEQEIEKLNAEIRKYKIEIDLLQTKYNLFLAQQFDNADYRERNKEQLDIANEKKMIENKIDLLIKELELKKLEYDRTQIVEDNKVQYLDDPLLKNGTLVISDRKIELGLIIDDKCAEKVENDIDFYNNKDSKKPIFIIFDVNYGGMLSSGDRIVNKIKKSKAPVYIVVKSLVASMSAVITTLATKSYCFKNARILHHQPFNRYFLQNMNVKEHEENLKYMKESWERLMGPVAKKMGISTKTLMDKMYEHNSKGDWIEFGDNAKKLKWVDDIIDNIQDTSVKIKYKDSKDQSSVKQELSNFIEEHNNYHSDEFCYMYIPKYMSERFTLN